MASYQELSEAIQKGNAPKAKEITTALLAEKNPPGEILNKGLLDGMDKVGQRFKCNLCGFLLFRVAQGAGIEVVDLGIDVSADKYIQGLKDNPDARTIGMSALLTTTMTGMKEVIDRFEKEGLRKKVKFMVGGAPLTDQYAREIGADGYAPDAASAAEKIKAFLRA